MICALLDFQWSLNKKWISSDFLLFKINFDPYITDFTSIKKQLLSKMVGSNGTMIAIRLVRSKLRKREEHSNSVHPVTDVVLQTATTTTTQVQSVNNNNQSSPMPHVLHSDLTYRGQFLWTQPPPPTQQYLYNHNQVSWVLYRTWFGWIGWVFIWDSFERNEYWKKTFISKKLVNVWFRP